MHFSKILVSLAAIVGASAEMAVPSPRAFGVVTSIPRGGAGPVDADLAMKTYAGLCAAQGALDYLSPKTGNKLYNLAVDDAMSSFAQTYVGGNQAGTAVALVSSVFMGLDGTKACGWALVPGILNMAKSLLDGTPQELGCNVPMQYLHFAVTAFAARAALLGTENAGTILKYFAGYIALATGQCRVAPKASLKAWGFPEGTATNAFTVQLLGQSGLALATVLYTLGVEGGSAATAVGRTAVVFLASIIEFLASGTLEDMGVDVNKCYPWVVLSAVAAGTLLL